MMRSSGFKILAIAGAIVVGAYGCTQKQAPQKGRPAVEKAVAVLHPTEGNDVHGLVTFTREANGVHVVADIEGLTPGDHGFHIHQFGDCSGADGKTAGGHFNPDSVDHGGPTAAVHHVGDLGNITADDSGKAHLDQVFSFLALGGARSIVGRGVIIHAKADDLTSQPTGAAGARVACGVIGIAKP
ncbi:MAG: superoxide dismutase family protein [bacterium]